MKSLKETIRFGRNIFGAVLLATLFGTALFGQNADTKNLLTAWPNTESGPAEEIAVTDAVAQAVSLEQTEPKTISFSAESKAENVGGEPEAYYSVFINIVYADNSTENAVCTMFKTGTHDWEKSASSFTPKKPIKSLQYHLLFRNRTGKAWFRNAVLTEEKAAAETKK